MSVTFIILISECSSTDGVCLGILRIIFRTQCCKTYMAFNLLSLYGAQILVHYDKCGKKEDVRDMIFP